MPVVLQLRGDPRSPVGALERGVHCLDLPGQLQIRSVAGSPVGCGGSPVVEAGPGDPDSLAQPLHAVAWLVVSDELEAVHQRVSPAKYRAALRRMSRSSSSSRTRRRNVAFSSSTEPVAVGGLTESAAVAPRRWSST